MQGSDTLLADLDDDQRAVAVALGGPVSVLAGAGAGKTRALTYRIAYGVATDAIAPKNAMVLTFTTKAAGELRSRLAQLGADGVNVRTFHSAALAQLNHFWHKLTGAPAPNVLDSKARTIADAALRSKLTVDIATARDVASLIEWRKVRMLGLAELETEFTMGRRSAPGRLTAEQALDLMRGYETLLGERRQVDFEDVLLLTAGMLTDEVAIARDVQQQYRHFLVDEFQDVSPVQWELLRLWLGERDDLCVVGDASQTIYSFAGASPNYLLNFADHFPNAREFRLERNYRSSAAIVDRANTLMRGRPGALRLTAVFPEGPAPEFVGYRNDLAEAEAVASHIEAVIAGGGTPDALAVLYRTNAQSEPIERALRTRGISYRVRGGVAFFDRPEIRQALMQLRAEALASRPERPLFQVVSDVLWSLGWSTTAPETGGAVRERWESLNVLAHLADTAAPGTSLVRFVDDLRQRAEYGTEPALGAVTLATIHSAKGLEWESVWVIGASEGLLPLSYATGFEAIDEERRLAYVAFTRARRELRVSWAESGARGSQSVSRFVAESRSRSADAAPA
ncbi:MAG TPA: ATP-dependent helicase [Microbacteriaceae bacterium]|nr:ATP-dependent helicase [Microbacteriaceae bacterium]